MTQPWHTLPTTEVQRTTDSRAEGLTAQEALERLQAEGPNVLPRVAGDSLLTLVGRQVLNPLVLVLLGAAGLAFVMGKPTDAVVVLVVVALNALIGVIQEHKAGKAIAALADMVPERATVLREGERRSVDAADLVSGDRVYLQGGDKVPADLRLLEIRDLRVEESALTGESLPVSKQVDPVPTEAALGDRTCMAYSGTLVTSGAGWGVVVGTGSRTELGRIAELMRQTTNLETPLMRDLARFGTQLSWAILAIALLLLGVGLLRGWTFLDGTMAALSLAVAAIPEGLPAVVSITLAVGVRRMAVRRAVIRNLPAVETLGATTIVCSDKTGTLTRNEMSVRIAWTSGHEHHLDGEGYGPAGTVTVQGRPSTTPELQALLTAGALCSDATVLQEDGRWVLHGDPTEGALVAAANRGGLDVEALRRAHPRTDELPFESERQFMATLHGDRLLMKGAPEVILRRCTLEAAEAAQVLEEAGRLASQGLRVLAFAEKTTDRLDETTLGNGFHLLGLQGMIDPPRSEAIQAIAACHRAGIQVKMITGDHPATALAIGRELGLTGQAFTGRDLDGLDDAGFAQAARTGSVFARVAPEHKLRLVQSLQADGHVVAMTGDGVNDAPALKRADIGVAMGITGTAVSREAADMVLTDDNFASIRSAVEEGRRVYDNLIKALAFLLPTNFGQGLVLLIAVLFFPFSQGHPLMPVTPVQILWINLVVAVTLALPLAFEAPESDLMGRPPREPGKPLLSAFVFGRTAFAGTLFALGAVGLFLWELGGAVGSGEPLRRAQTLAVTGLALMQAAYLLPCRSLRRGFWRAGAFSNPLVYAGIGVLLALQVAMVHLPLFQKAFGTVSLGLRDWSMAALAGVAVLVLLELEKALLRMRRTANP